MGITKDNVRDDINYRLEMGIRESISDLVWILAKCGDNLEEIELTIDAEGMCHLKTKSSERSFSILKELNR